MLDKKTLLNLGKSGGIIYLQKSGTLSCRGTIAKEWYPYIEGVTGKKFPIHTKQNSTPIQNGESWEGSQAVLQNPIVYITRSDKQKADFKII